MEDKVSGITYVHDSSPSVKSRLLTLLFRSINLKKKFSQDFIGCLAGHQQKRCVPYPPSRLRNELECSSWQVEGRNVYRLAPKQNKSKKHVLFLHGGAYIWNAGVFHWNFVHQLIKDLNCTVIFPDYPLANFNTYKETISMVSSVYKQLVSEVGKDDLVIMGDSAGGGLSLALALKMKDEKIPQPDQIILLCPWLDITCSNPDIPKVEVDDPMLEMKSAKTVGKFYAGDLDPNHYLVSPINGDLKKLGRISLFVGTHEIVLPDSRKFKDVCEKQGVKINYFEYPKMFHDWMLVGFLPEARKATEQIEELINHTL